MGKKSNDILYLGIFILIVGVVLTIYSITSYTEISSLKKKIDFELIDDNNAISYEDRYAQYLSIAEFLNKKIDQNKNLPIKTTSCSYINYAKHNAIELHKLTTRRMKENETHKNTATSNIRTLYDKLKDYNTCPEILEHKNDLQSIITEIENSEKTKNFDKERMQKFINGYYDKNIENVASEEELKFEQEVSTTDIDAQIKELGLENYIE